MTPLEILSATVSGEPAPRVPIFCNVLDQGAGILNMLPEQYFSKGEYVAEGQLKMLKHYGHDNAWSASYVGNEAQLLGCKKILFAKHGVPNVADFVLKSWDDIEKFEIPEDITQHPHWQSTDECLKILHQEVGSTHPICAYVTAATSLPVILMGMDKWIELVIAGPTDLRDLLVKKCSDFVQQQLVAYRAAGANVIIYANPFATTYFIPKKLIVDWSMPWMQHDLKDGVDSIVFYGGMGPINSVTELVIDKLNVNIFYPAPEDDLSESKRFINGKGLTSGVLDDIKMIHWTEEQTRNEVKRIMALGKPGGHFLFGTGFMPLDIPEANIIAMLDAAFEYGRN